MFTHMSKANYKPKYVFNFEAKTPRSSLRTPSTKSNSAHRSESSFLRHAHTPQSASRASSSSYGIEQPSTIVAIAEGRGNARGQIGMASIDLRRSVLTLTEFTDGQNYSKIIAKLNFLNPIEMILPDSMHFNCTKKTNLSEALSENFSCSISTVQRKYFNDQKGMEYVKTLGLPQSRNIEVEIASKYYCLAAVAALLKYIEYIQRCVYAPGSLKIVYKALRDATLIDPGTIESRYDTVAVLLSDENLYHSLKSVISSCVDLDHLISLCIQIPKYETIKNYEYRITNVICLKHMLNLVDPICEALKGTDDQLLSCFREGLQDDGFQAIRNILSKYISEDTTYTKNVLDKIVQKCFLVKFNLNGMLDVCRKGYTEIVDEMTELAVQIGDTHGLGVTLRYNGVRGYHLQVRNTTKKRLSLKQLPPAFIKANRFRNVISFTTQEMIQVMNEVLNEVREHVHCLYRLSECVATLDMLVCFATNAALSNYVKPILGEALVVQKGKHPILDRIWCEPPVPNDFFACQGGNINIITGPNMSGKSTILRQVVLLQIMAQMGSFVPAESARFKLVTEIFSRVNTDDNLETNSSTFCLEMKEMNYILQSMSESSLIIIDELGRVTHYLRLTKLATMYHNVGNFYMDVLTQERTTGDSNVKYVYTFQMKRGIQMCELSSMPKTVLLKAKEYHQILKTDHADVSVLTSEEKLKMADFNAQSRIRELAHKNMTDVNEIRSALGEIRLEYTKSLNEANQLEYFAFQFSHNCVENTCYFKESANNESFEVNVVDRKKLVFACNKTSQTPLDKDSNRFTLSVRELELVDCWNRMTLKYLHMPRLESLVLKNSYIPCDFTSNRIINLAFEFSLLPPNSKYFRINHCSAEEPALDSGSIFVSTYLNKTAKFFVDSGSHILGFRPKTLDRVIKLVDLDSRGHSTRIRKDGLEYLERSTSISDTWTLLFLIALFLLFSVIVSIGYAIFVYKYLPRFSPPEKEAKNRKTSVADPEEYGILEVRGPYSDYCETGQDKSACQAD
ncbi:DgyrCDS8301 [Dimorphilus gyrociliatus]|uniref:DgyrCDS8301 n=1 Tax=Dimorphilus gyrociliatus TaxID=2664684 RepID=A0A7I8VVG4_9ANNE|nr:DgyrCDS8301 [Dimorphilus gyrociliatus]